ncbi:hypothetical protein JAAARDRAFT_35290 [Jaapia argillacea MUCL 33604]|uniref:rRNA adenine N(6)-methyltransferase n=1 Tax=Jaapia argillacea MUCL 33604 TaxID=933084 RepID=A0A067PS86_9AGAM|nr:hypothetical protein JAAARDRAFT_35290 [Jaapia argillacea MUCL 33604]
MSLIWEASCCRPRVPLRRLFSTSLTHHASKKQEVFDHQPGVDLPPLDHWRKYFKALLPVKDRTCVRNPKTAASLANSFIYWDWDKMEPSHKSNGLGKVVIEAFPGPGQLTRALMKLPESRMRKLIVLEDYPPYLEYLRPLEAVDPRVKVIPMSGFGWDTYRLLHDEGHLEGIAQDYPWDEVHPDLHFISHIPQSILGEQLVAQFFRCMPERQWLFRYGRVPMSLIMSEFMWTRLSSGPKDLQRCKVTIMAEASATSALSLPCSTLLPHNDHWHPDVVRLNESKSESKRLGTPLAAVNILPLKDQVITAGMLDKWDFVLRRLFVLKSTPLKTAINSLAPGAKSLLATLTDESLPANERVDIRLPVKKLSVKDWALILRAFDNWPFAPDSLMISAGFSDDRERS